MHANEMQELTDGRHHKVSPHLNLLQRFLITKTQIILSNIKSCENGKKVCIM